MDEFSKIYLNNWILIVMKPVESKDIGLLLKRLNIIEWVSDFWVTDIGLI
jgi:hypothetical protein